MRVDFWEVHKETEESSKEELDLLAQLHKVEQKMSGCCREQNFSSSYISIIRSTWEMMKN